jgi:hypothetical protein
MGWRQARPRGHLGERELGRLGWGGVGGGGWEEVGPVGEIWPKNGGFKIPFLSFSDLILYSILF